MTDAPTAFEGGKRPNGGLDWSHKSNFRRIFATQATRSYLYLSLGMGLLAFGLPILLVAAEGYGKHLSISHYYHGSDLSRNLLVGILWATGVFLFLFQGLSRWENWLLNLAGLAAISIAMNPMAESQQGNPFLSIHNLSAIFFFLCLATVAIFFSKTRIQYIIYPPKRLRYKRAYEAAGIAMVAMPLAVSALHFWGGRTLDSWVFWIESLGIWAFAAYWFVKTAEYKTLLGVRWSASTWERRQMDKARAATA